MPLPVIEVDDYSAVPIAEHTSTYPTCVYYQPTYPNGTLWPWPYPTDITAELELFMWSVLLVIRNDGRDCHAAAGIRRGSDALARRGPLLHRSGGYLDSEIWPIRREGAYRNHNAKQPDSEAWHRCARGRPGTGMRWDPAIWDGDETSISRCEMKKFFLIPILLLLFSGLASAQQRASGNLTATASTCTAGVCVEQLAIADNSAIWVQVIGSFSATLSFEGTADSSTWFSMPGVVVADGSIATSTTGTGNWQFSVAGLSGFRVRCSAYTSGTAEVLINMSKGSSQTPRAE